MFSYNGDYFPDVALESALTQGVNTDDADLNSTCELKPVAA